MIKKATLFILAFSVAAAASYVWALPLEALRPSQYIHPARYASSFEDAGYYYFTRKLKQEDYILYESYLEYGPPAIECLYWVSGYLSRHKLIAYRPKPEDIIRLREIASGMPENSRKDYIENCFKHSVSVIVGGSSDLPIDSVLYFAHIAGMLNQPFYILNNNRNSKFSRESGDLVISGPSMEIRDRINALIAAGKKREGNIWVDIESIDELERAIDLVLAEHDYKVLNLFAVTHGVGDKLIFNTAGGKSFTVSAEEISSILEKHAEVNLFLATCYSNVFAEGISGRDINIVSASDKILVDGDLAVSMLLGLANGDFRITPEELYAISEGSLADGEDNYCYYYHFNGRQFRVIDHKVTWAHKVRFGYKDSELDIRVKGFEGRTSILYFQVGRIQ
ncbi:MAG: hypothetical protein ACQEP5_08460 [Actinomycetota bacterium]